MKATKDATGCGIFARTQLRQLRRIQVVAVGVGIAAMLLANTWFAVRHLREQENERLFTSASSGDLLSVGELARRNAVTWLEKVAQNRNAFADSRVAALEALDERASINSDHLAVLLLIGQAFVVRHRTAAIFDKHGCDEVCLSATLRSLHDLWAGRLTLEAQQTVTHPPPYPSPDSDGTKVVEELRAITERDYLGLLNKDPCAARTVMAREYVGEVGFTENLNRRLNPCR